MDAIFGALHRDPQHQISREELAGIAQLLGDLPPVIESEPGFALAVNRGSLHGAAATSFAVSDDRSLWAAVLGEVERGDELAREGKGAGFDPRSTSAEIALHLFRIHGANFVNRLQGFFAIVLWDSSARRLLLYADRSAGMRTLYYYDGPGAFRFGSAAKAVLAQPGVPRLLNRRALEDLLVLAHPVAPGTLFSGVQLVPAGCFVEIVAGRSPRLTRYWRHHPYKSAGEDLSTLGDRYFDALIAAVQRNAGDRSRVGVLLSGGVDSAAVVSLLRATEPARTICTYTLDSGEEDTGDRDTAHAVARLFGTEHRTIKLRGPASLDPLPSIIWHYEAPGTHLHPFYWLTRAVSREHDFVLGGYGNDLLWGTGQVHADSIPSQEQVGRGAMYLRSRRHISRENLRRLLLGAPDTDIELEERISRSMPQLDDPREDLISLNETLFGDQRTSRELGKTAVDAHSLWVAAPYCDSAVVSVVENIPIADRARRRRTGAVSLKSFFKKQMAARGVLPTEIVHRRKNWLRSPVAQWLRGELGETIEALILRGRARERGLFDLAYVRQLFDEHRTGAGDYSRLLTTLASVELWFRLFIDPPSLAPPRQTLSEYALGER